MRLALAAGMVAAVGFATSSQAALIATDSFHVSEDEDTYPDDQLMPENPTSNLSGFQGNWTTAWNWTSDLRSQPGQYDHNLVAGSTADGHIYSTDGGASRSMYRKLDYSVSGVDATAESEYHFSFTMSSAGADRLGGLGLRGPEVWPEGSGSLMDNGTRIDDTNLGGVSAGFENDGFAMWVNGVKTSLTGGSAVAGETYFAHVSVANNGDGNNDEVTVDVYDSNATELGSPLASATVSDQDVTGRMYNIAIQKLTADDSDGDGELYYDEFRYGTSSSDIVVPEPASLALLGLGGLGLIARRRKA